LFSETFNKFGFRFIHGLPNGAGEKFTPPAIPAKRKRWAKKNLGIIEVNKALLKPYVSVGLTGAFGGL